MRERQRVELNTDISTLMRGDDEKPAVWDQPLVSMAGDTYSLTVIENMIFERWGNPLVMYGLYMGAIGTPNLRPEAYRAGSVWQQLVP